MRLLLALLLLCCLPTPARAKGPAAGRPAPALAATQLDGKHFALGDAAGKVVIVNFWATWCAPCRQEMPVLDAFYKKHRGEGVTVIAISADDPADIAQVNAVMAAFSFPAALLSQSQAKGYGRLWRLPVTFVVDRHGILRRDGWHAPPALDAAALDAAVLPLLNER